MSPLYADPKESAMSSPYVLSGKIIGIDPGHGGTAETDHFRVGPAGEREEHINLRVALILRDLLKESGAHPVLTREEDLNVPLVRRAEIIREAGADVFISIHHNATADRSINYPIIYFHGNASQNQAGVRLARCLADSIKRHMFPPGTPAVIASDHVIFPQSGTAVLRHSYGIPGVIGEASFFSCPDEELRLMNPEYNRIEAMAWKEALEEFFAQSVPMVFPKVSIEGLTPFPVLQEAERMNPEALRWQKNFKDGLALLDEGTTDSLTAARDHFTASARAFPDSPVARSCHENLAIIFKRLSMPDESRAQALRVQEHYPLLQE